MNSNDVHLKYFEQSWISATMYVCVVHNLWNSSCTYQGYQMIFSSEVSGSSCALLPATFKQIFRGRCLIESATSYSEFAATRPMLTPDVCAHVIPNAQCKRCSLHTRGKRGNIVNCCDHMIWSEIIFPPNFYQEWILISYREDSDSLLEHYL